MRAGSVRIVTRVLPFAFFSRALNVLHSRSPAVAVTASSMLRKLRSLVFNVLRGRWRHTLWRLSLAARGVDDRTETSQSLDLPQHSNDHVSSGGPELATA